MRQFDVYRLRSSRADRSGGLVAIVQHDTAEDLETRVVAPLSEPDRIPALEKLRPVVRIDGAEHVLAVDRLAAVERRTLGQRVGTVATYRDEIISAPDLLFTGY